MDDLNTLWSKLLSDYARILTKATKLSGGYQAFIDAAAALIRQCYGALSSLTDNEYTVDGGNPFTQIDVITELVTESGPIVSIDNKLREQSIERLIVDIEPVQSGSGDPSPDNVRPIIGWNSVNVIRAGESALKPSAVYSETKNGITFTSDGKGTYSVKGTNTSTEAVQSAILPVQSFTIPPSTSHTFYLNNDAINSKAALQFMIGSTIIDAWTFNALNRVSANYGAMGNKLCDGIRINVAAGQTVDITFSPMLLAKENTNVYSVSLESAGTVYGGSLDVISGELTVDRKIVNLGDMTYTYNTANAVFTFTLSDKKAPTSGVIDYFCDTYVSNAPVSRYNAATMGIQAITASGYSKHFLIKDTNYTDIATFKAAMVDKYLVYPLAIPITYQLAFQEIAMLLGRNNIWSTAGDVTVTYPAKSDKDCNGGYPGS